MQNESVHQDIQSLSAISAVPKILEAVATITGMRFAAIARVTDSRWTACAVLDRIEFGLAPGDELPLETTICNEVRDHREPVAFVDAHADERWRDHHTPRIYGLRSYLSVPIFLGDGSFFGTLCAIDPEPARFDTTTAIRTAQLFAELVAIQLGAEFDAQLNRAALSSALQTAIVRQQTFRDAVSTLNNALQSITFDAYTLRQDAALGETARGHVRAIENRAFAMASTLAGLADRGTRLGHANNRLQIAARAFQHALQVAISSATASRSGRMLTVAVAIDRPVTCDLVPLCEACSTLIQYALETGVSTRPVEVDARTSGDRFLFSVAFQSESADDDARSLFAATETVRQHAGSLRREHDEQATRWLLEVPISAAAGTIDSISHTNATESVAAR